MAHELLLELQRKMAAAVMQPLTHSDGMRRRSGDGRQMRKVAAEFIKPNRRLSSFERLEIYNRQYWFRILDTLAEDFPGLRAVIGVKVSIAWPEPTWPSVPRSRSRCATWARGWGGGWSGIQPT